MAALLTKDSRLCVAGITGHQGQFHTRAMLDFGTQVVAGVTPGKAGQEVHGVPVFDTVRAAVRETEADASLIFVPARFAADAVMEAASAGCELIVAITEHIPVHDAMRMISFAKGHGARVLGPNCPGIISPGHAKAGIMPSSIFKEGKVGVISRSGTLTYEIVNQLSINGLGQSTCIGLGGDPVNGTSFVDALEILNADPATESLVLIGEIGGTAEEEAAEYIKANVSKPTVAYIAGRSAPPGKTMGHAGAIVTRGRGTAASKAAAFTAAGVKVADAPAEVAKLLGA